MVLGLRKTNFMNLQYNFINSNKLEYLNLPTSKSSFDQILASLKLHHFSDGNVYTRHTLHISKKHIFGTKNGSPTYSPSANNALHSAYSQGSDRIYDPLEDHFVHYSETNLNPPLFIPWKALSTHDPPPFSIHHIQPPPLVATQTQSLFHP